MVLTRFLEQEAAVMEGRATRKSLDLESLLPGWKLCWQWYSLSPVQGNTILDDDEEPEETKQ
jgi:hypothetical protein